MLSAEFATRARTKSPARPIPSPTATASTTARTNDPATDHKDTVVAIAVIADRSRTSAEASLSRLSPSRTVTTRGEASSRFTIEVATASVGLRMAPSAIPNGRLSPGMSQVNRNPSRTELTTTRATDRAPIAVKSRRKSIVGRLTADE